MADERVRVMLAMTDTAYRDPPAVRAALGSADVLLTSWGCPPVDANAVPVAEFRLAAILAAGKRVHRADLAVEA